MPKQISDEPLIIDGRLWKGVKVTIELSARSNFLVSSCAFKNGGTKSSVTTDLLAGILSDAESIDEVNNLISALVQRQKLINKAL